jgi:hypothetical protein
MASMLLLHRMTIRSWWQISYIRCCRRRGTVGMSQISCEDSPHDIHDTPLWIPLVVCLLWNYVLSRCVCSVIKHLGVLIGFLCLAPSYARLLLDVFYKTTIVLHGITVTCDLVDFICRFCLWLNEKCLFFSVVGRKQNCVETWRKGRNLLGSALFLMF